MVPIFSKAAAQASSDGATQSTVDNTVVTVYNATSGVMSSLFKWRARVRRVSGEDEPSELPFALNNGGRVDWQLPESEDFVTHAYVAAMAAHAAYFKSEDVAAFVAQAEAAREALKQHEKKEGGSALAALAQYGDDDDEDES